MFRLLLAAYSVLLTFLLLVPDPLSWLGWLPSSGQSSGYGQHLIAFTILGVLAALAFQTRLRRRLAVLILYALVVESLQAFVPQRSIQWIDYAENLVGLLIGSAIGYWITRKCRSAQAGQLSADE